MQCTLKRKRFLKDVISFFFPPLHCLPYTKGLVIFYVGGGGGDFFFLKLKKKRDQAL